MLQQENIESKNIPIKYTNIDFSFGKSNNLKNNSVNENNRISSKNDINNIYHQINDNKQKKMKENRSNFIFKILNLNKNNKNENSLPIFNDLINIHNADKATKPKLDITNTNFNSPKMACNKIKYYYKNFSQNDQKIRSNDKLESLFNLNYIKNLNYDKETKKEEILEIFDIKDEHKLPYEINYFLDNPKCNYDFEHQNDNNSNYQYINENFIDILLNCFKKKMILNINIRPIKEIQTEINFSKRNILISWLTEMNFKYIKDQNVLFTAINYLDRILYSKNININEFQLIGILCLNLALKMENHHKVLYIEEIISLIGGLGDKDCVGKTEVIRKIKKMENKICDFIGFDFVVSTSVLILKRLIQMINIQNKNVEEIFCSISNFFLEISLYDEQFYIMDDFVKALSSLLITKKILKKYFYKIGFHDYLTHCSKLKKDEIKSFYSLATKTIKSLKNYKYGSTIFIKYQHKDFHNVINKYLNSFINNCIEDKTIGI